MRWYITFHGGEDAKDWNNIHSFDLMGKPTGKMLDEHSLPGHLELRELRGFAFGPDGDLYIANAFKDDSQILRFHGELNANGRHAFRDVFSSRDSHNPGLDHPFAVTFGPDGHLYVPSQDTNVVSRYAGPGSTSGEPGAPLPIADDLMQSAAAHLPPGTFVASNKHTADGLQAVRGTVFAGNGNLLVADRDANTVKAYHGSTGAPVRAYTHAHLKTPIHVLPHGDNALLVGSRDSNAIFKIDLETGAIDVLVETAQGGLKGPAGMAIGPDGWLYICSRESKQILRFDAETGRPDSAPFITDLPDFPEFIVLVDN